jgi:hypothetical protein
MEVSWIIEIKYGWLINSFEVSLFFNVIPEHIDAVIAAWHKVNSCCCRIDLLH